MGTNDMIQGHFWAMFAGYVGDLEDYKYSSYTPFLGILESLESLILGHLHIKEEIYSPSIFKED